MFIACTSGNNLFHWWLGSFGMKASGINTLVSAFPLARYMYVRTAASLLLALAQILHFFIVVYSNYFPAYHIKMHPSHFALRPNLSGPGKSSFSSMV